jgi:hypothetical protein
MLMDFPSKSAISEGLRGGIGYGCESVCYVLFCLLSRGSLVRIQHGSFPVTLDTTSFISLSFSSRFATDVSNLQAILWRRCNPEQIRSLKTVSVDGYFSGVDLLGQRGRGLRPQSSLRADKGSIRVARRAGAYEARSRSRISMTIAMA